MMRGQKEKIRGESFANATAVALSSHHHHSDSPQNLLEGIMTVKESEDGKVSITIPRPEDMSVDRFLTLIARLERIVDQLGGSLHVKS
jgi:hypothetical protein